MILLAIATPRPENRAFLLLRRLWALALRHVYLHIGSWPRILEMLYWPIINMLMWSFASVYVTRQFGVTSSAGISASLIAGALLNELSMRVSINSLMLFLEEVWSRNLGHLFASPLKISEYAVGLITVSLTRTCIALIPAILLAKFMFGFWLFSLGMPALVFIALLAMNGCWYGLLIVSLPLRFGLAAEWLAWMSSWLLIPFMAPYYPVAILPPFLRPIAHALPASHVFEAMRALIDHGEWQGHELLTALGLNILYLILAALVLRLSWLAARKEGRLLENSE